MNDYTDAHDREVVAKALEAAAASFPANHWATRRLLALAWRARNPQPPVSGTEES